MRWLGYSYGTDREPGCCLADATGARAGWSHMAVSLVVEVRQKPDCRSIVGAPQTIGDAALSVTPT